VRKPTALLLLTLIICSAVSAQAPTPPNLNEKEAKAPTEASLLGSVTHEMTAEDVVAFLDGVVPTQLKVNDIAGATVVIVKDGKVLAARGYGYADVEKKKPVSPDTLFRPGSVSKLFTWTAVMQLFEQGKLDLDRDVNTYLDFKIPDAFDKPITLKNIMTHSAGFEEQIKDLFSPDATKLNLGEYVKSHIPKRIFPPGTVPAYSNYATALAGYIVERVSGKPFSEYVTDNIMKPLGMTRSTFVQPLPAELSPLMSNGYQLGSDPAKPFEIVSPFPAGSLSSSAADMAQFMLAHLQDGQLNNAQILKPETARMMHSRLLGLDDAANAMCYGFYEESRNGHRIIGHGGDTLYFHSDLHLVLDARVGFFVSYNSLGRGDTAPRIMLWESFLDRYFPFSIPASSQVSTAKEDVKSISGVYMLSRKSDSFLKTASLLGEFTVSANKDGFLEVGQLLGTNGKPKMWEEVAPMRFRERNGQDLLIFKPDQSGRMQMILSYPFFIGERVGLFENRQILLPVAAVSGIIMLLTILIWPVSWLVRRYYGQRLELTFPQQLLRFGVRIVFVLDLVFIVALLGLTTYGLTHLEVFSDQGNKWFHLIQVVGIIGAVGTLVVIVDAISTWTSKRQRIWAKLHRLLLVGACLGFLWFAFAGHLLVFRSAY